MPQVCRTCLEEITDQNFLSLNDVSNGVKNELIACIPELDLNLVPQAAVCVYCASALHAAYDFKQKCLQTEETIRNHMQDTVQLDLENIKKECGTEDKFDIVRGPGIGLEVIYIKDDDDITGESSEGELIVGNANSITRIEGEAEPVKLFLNMNHNLSSQISGFTNTQKPQIKKGEESLCSKKDPPKTLFNNVKSANKSFTCTHCNFTAERSLQLKQHMQTHQNQNKKEYSNVQKSKNNGAKCLKCTNCEFTTGSKTTLKIHTQTHTLKRFSCSKCNFQTEYRVALFSHMKLHDDSNVKEEKSFTKHPTTKHLKCSNCNFETTNLGIFQKHVGCHKKNESYNCNVCTYQSSNPTALKNHMNFHKGANPYKCTSCDYSSPNKHRLATHILIHTGEKPFECNYCNYKATQKGHIDRHLKFHSGSRPFQCNECTFSASKLHYLQAHMVVHDK